MANENEIALVDPVEAEAEAAREETPVSQPETKPGEDAEETPQPAPVAPASTEAEAESEARCLVEMGLYLDQRCGRKLHTAPDGVDEQPVCLMHSEDPEKLSGALFNAFWSEFEKILEEAGEKEALFERFFFPRTNFSGRKFKAICRFTHATFSQGANFSRTTFMQDSYFRWVTFIQDADFHNTVFMQRANFYKAIFTQNAFFRLATFTQNAEFRRTIFEGTANWIECRFLDQAEFRHTKFVPKEPKVPSAVFSLAKFAKPGEIFFEDVDLSRALFLNCDVSAVWFTSSVIWARRKGHRGLAVFEEEILLNPEYFAMKRHHEEIDHGAVEQIYHQLQKNYDTRLDYRKANDFHYGEMEMRRLAVPVSRWPRWPRRWQHRKWNFIALYRWASDYGNSYREPLKWLLRIVLGTALLFPLTGLEMKQPQPGYPAIASYTSVWNQQDTWSNNRWTEAKLIGKSGITAIDTATFQRNPEYSPVYPWGRALGILETLLTSSLFALFLLAIRRQFRR